MKFQKYSAGMTCQFVRAAILVALASVSTSALAQTSAAPSRVTPQSVAPVEVRADGSVVLPETRVSAAPAGAEALSVRITRVDVSGGTPDLASATAAIIDPLAARTVSVADIYSAAARIEALYAQTGRVLTRATVPPQRIVDGATVQITIVEGFIEAVDTNAVPANVRAAVARRLQPLVGARGLTLPQIERHVLLAGRVPGVSLQSTVTPGGAVGGAVLVINADYRPVAGSISTNNRLSDAYRNWSFDGQIVLNSLLGGGEQIYGIASTAQDFRVFGGAPLRRIAGAGIIVPVGSNGLTFNSEYLHADTNPRVPSGALPVSGTLDQVAARLSYPAILNRRESLNITGSFVVLNEQQEARGFNIVLSADRVRYVTLGVDWAKAISGRSVASADIAIAQGFDAFGARNQADATRTGILLSRLGSEPDFTRINAGANFRTGFAGGLELVLTARGQASLSGALPSSAQFSLDAADGLSGFDLGSINVDSGATGRVELTYLVRQNGFALTPYVFGAAGVGDVAQPTALERGSVNGWSLGGGLRGSVGQHISVNAELSRNHANIFTQNDTRLMTGVGVRF